MIRLAAYAQCNKHRHIILFLVLVVALNLFRIRPFDKTVFLESVLRHLHSTAKFPHEFWANFKSGSKFSSAKTPFSL